MKAITDIKELRGIQLDLLEEIHRFCQEHHIVYYLSSGTLLGAVRHGGYIPWDDDIDLYMPRESYERFVKEYTDTEGRFTLMEPRRSNHYFYTFAKLTDSRTMMVEDSYTSYPIGVYVDIFPLDYCAPTDTVWKKQKFLTFVYRAKFAKNANWSFGRRVVNKLFSMILPWSKEEINMRKENMLKNMLRKLWN